MCGSIMQSHSIMRKERVVRRVVSCGCVCVNAKVMREECRRGRCVVYVWRARVESGQVMSAVSNVQCESVRWCPRRRGASSASAPASSFTLYSTYLGHLSRHVLLLRRTRALRDNLAINIRSHVTQQHDPPESLKLADFCLRFSEPAHRCRPRRRRASSITCGAAAIWY